MAGEYSYTETAYNELGIIINLMDRQFERIEELFRDGNIEETTYEALTLALINKINIISVEEVMPTEADLNKKEAGEDDPLAQL